MPGRRLAHIRYVVLKVLRSMSRSASPCGPTLGNVRNNDMPPGHIRCRFKETSEITKAFGRKIASFRNPRFICGVDMKTLWIIKQDALDIMINQGQFRAPNNCGSFLEVQASSEDLVNIKFMADNFPAESISGSSDKERVPEDENTPGSNTPVPHDGLYSEY